MPVDDFTHILSHTLIINNRAEPEDISGAKLQLSSEAERTHSANKTRTWRHMTGKPTDFLNMRTSEPHQKCGGSMYDTKEVEPQQENLHKLFTLPLI